MKRTHKQNGITLVALVITIIILLILAGISISALTNQGLFTQAQNAKNLTEEKTAEENEILTNYLEQMNEIIGGTSGETKPVTWTWTDTDNDGTKNIGDIVTCSSGENFYIISTEGENYALLAEKNIDTSSLTQSDRAGTVTFCTDPDSTYEGYWTSIEGITYPYDINNLESERATAINYAKAYGRAKGVTGRLLTYEEAKTLKVSYSSMIYGTNTTTAGYLNYWLGTAFSESSVYEIDGEESGLHGSGFGYEGTYGVRPVIEISKSLIS